jgi:hypothetical protein
LVVVREFVAVLAVRRVEIGYQSHLSLPICPTRCRVRRYGSSGAIGMLRRFFGPVLRTHTAPIVHITGVHCGPCG